MAERGRAVWKPPSWIRTTNARTPCSFRSFWTSALIVSTSSRNSRPATPVGVTIVGRPLERQADERDLRVVDLPDLVRAAGSSRPSPRSTTFAARYWKTAPGNGSTSWQSSTGWQPPNCIRQELLRSPRRTRGCRRRTRRGRSALSASIAGSSWKRPEISGLAPIRSPAPTVIVFVFAARRRLDVRREVLDAAGGNGAWRPRGRGRVGPQQPTWIVPACVGSRCAVEVVDREQLDVRVVVLRPLGRERLRRSDRRRAPASKATRAMIRLMYYSPLCSVDVTDSGRSLCHIPIVLDSGHSLASAQVSPTPTSTASAGSSG